MPTRLIREGILSSDRIERLDWQAEVFYRRLMSKVDDFGLFDARPAMLRASLYPLRVDRVREADIARWIAACETAGVIALYAHDGKPYGQMLDTGWQTRTEPKHPLPPWHSSGQLPAAANTCEQVKTPVTVVGVVVEDEVGIARKRARSPETALPEGFSISSRVRAWAAEKGHVRLDEHLESFIRKCNAKDYRYRDWDAAFMNAIAEDWGKVATRPQPVAKPGAARLSPLAELERDAQIAGIKRGIDETTTHFRVRVDEMLARQA